MLIIKKNAWVIVPMVVVTYFSWLTRSFQLDDALIYMRYIENFHAGFGLVYNPGEKFNGLTSPLFTLIILLGRGIYSDLQSVVIFISAMFLLAAAVIAALTFANNVAERLLIASGIGSVSYFYLTFGMETSLFLMLIATSLYLYRIGSPWFVVMLALLVITRSEGIFLALPICLDFLKKHKRLPDLRFVIFGLIIFLAPYLFNYIYYNDVLAATGGAKIGQGRSGLWGDGIIFLKPFYLRDWAFSGSTAAVLFFALASVFGFTVSLKEQSRITAITFVFLFSLVCFYSILNIPSYHWYYAPFFLFMTIFSVKCAWFVGSELLRRQRDLVKQRFFALTVGTIFLVPASNLVSFDEKGRHEPYAQIGMWLNQQTPTDASIAMVEIGTVGWYAQRTIIDILGLVNNYNADYIGDRNFYGWLTRYQPDYILRHEPAWGHEAAVALLEQAEAYRPVENFSFPGYVLLARAENYSNEDIRQLAQRRIDRLTTLKAFADSSSGGAPYVQMEASRLFAHAPSTVGKTLAAPATLISLEYGIKPEAEGKHSGLCFEVLRKEGGEVLMHDCIPTEAHGEALHQKMDVVFAGQPGDRLEFRVSCQGNCNYAWSYWSEISIE
jgi:arabinofuranosyltransferase